MRDLRELAVEGVLLTGWAKEAGWAASTLSRSLAAEGWTRIPGGGWAEPGRALDLPVRLWAGQLTTPGLVASHRSAAVLWRIEVLREELEFTDPLGTRRKVGARVHRLPLPPAEITVVGDLRVTTVVRTLVDLLRGGPREDALVALDSALSSRRYGGRHWRGPLIGGIEAVAEALDTPPVAGAPGVARAHRWLTLADPGAGSPAETVARLRMRDAGLRPETQAELLTPSGRLLRPDFLFRGVGVVVEIEGYAYHGTREAHRRDMARYNDLASCPEVRVVLRFGADEVFGAPEAFVRRVRAAVAGGG
ncbi:endonuclease domain-containing protein [Streptomyces sp. SYP-A7185]|uniref:endonuclease domain-containing protein n=1 Tax=Streptomyces sp. SYP-A7185 TaxID=3040076 RepID=UPI0038F6DD7A